MSFKKETNKEYLIVSVLWNDPHIVIREEIPANMDSLVFGPTLTIGLLVKKTKDFIVLVHTLERSEIDEADYTLIFTGCIVAIKEHASLKIRKIAHKGAN